MKLSIFKRESSKKGETKKIRRDGNIPAVIYGAKSSGETIYIDGAEFNAALRSIPQGRLSTTVFEIEWNKKKQRVVVKDIQYHVTTYQILHIDLQTLSDDVKVNINIPVECIGVADCQGIKLGGILRRVIRALRVECLPKDIPEKFEINVAPLKIAESRRLSDIDLPKEVRPLGNLQEVAVVVAKR